MFKQSVYHDLLSTLRSANATLRGLVDVARDTQKRKISYGQSMGFKSLLKARDCAVSLYREIVGGHHWHCGQDSAHKFAYLLPAPQSSFDFDSDEQVVAEFCVASKCGAASKDRDVWISSQSTLVEATTQMSSIVTNAQAAADTQPPVNGKKKTKGVSFAVPKKDPPFISDKFPKPPDNPSFALNAPKHILTMSQDAANLCVWVEKAHVVDPSLDYVLPLRDGQGKWNHTLRGAGSQAQSEVQSLENILRSSCDFMTPKTPKGTFAFRKNHRLQLAARLTLAAFILQDNWLADRWHIDDIQIEVSRDSNSIIIRPEKSFTISQMKAVRVKEKDPTSVTSSTLLSIGCALVQLSLRQTLEERRQDDEKRPSQAETDLLTARNALDDVQGHSDKAYYDVARACLYWDETTSDGLDDENFSREVFEKIVAPMLELWQSSKA